MVDVERRFGGLSRLYGIDGAARIRAAHVVVVGVGGVGSWAAEALVRSGVSEITLIDFDQIAESNINRQLHALTSTVGKAKVDALRERFAEINPECKVHAVEEFVEPQTKDAPSNWPQILPNPNVNAVIDACDQVRAKVLLAQWCCRQKISFVTVGAAGGKELAGLVEVDDLANVTHDPLLAQLRYRLRKEHAFPKQGKMKVACVFSRESVKQPDAACEMDGSLNCSGYGSVVAVTATFGFVAASHILSTLAGKSGR
ncbi:MAG: tRNA threonylcarbamoyladenosine dehydratase [Saezia sp.]